MDINVTNLIGLTKDAAIQFLTTNKIQFRIVQEDDRHYVGTADMKLNRVNLVIKNQIIVKADLG